jgi:hypothetical protein
MATWDRLVGRQQGEDTNRCVRAGDCGRQGTAWPDACTSDNRLWGEGPSTHPFIPPQPSKAACGTHLQPGWQLAAGPAVAPAMPEPPLPPHAPRHTTRALHRG